MIDQKGNLILPQVEYEAVINHQEDFDVTYFQVTCRLGRCLNHPLSEMFETVEQARESLAEIIKTKPDAKVGKSAWFYSSEEAEGRKDLLSRIVKLEMENKMLID